MYNYIRKVGQTNYVLCFNQNANYDITTTGSPPKRFLFGWRESAERCQFYFAPSLTSHSGFFYNERFEPLLKERGYKGLDCKTVFFCEPERRGQYLNERSGASVETARQAGDRL